MACGKGRGPTGPLLLPGAEALGCRPGWSPDWHLLDTHPLQRQSLLPPRQVPRGKVFRPHRRHLDYLKPVDFLGKAKVKVRGGIPGITLVVSPQIVFPGTWGCSPGHHKDQEGGEWAHSYPQAVPRVGGQCCELGGEAH
ncbi:hypothetical protein P7K49_002225 [Saguinus oedipus]|uniref:Uncharacterized protein n=1 Tax=Saguinus oedipus TaxID=9490 RepID=A0ABQ9WGS4_SAGOE|nr:hypothetical protein P7K49_002225 [Saguinus oedipus]